MTNYSVGTRHRQTEVKNKGFSRDELAEKNCFKNNFYIIEFFVMI